MLKVLPIVLAIALCFSNLGFITFGNNAPPKDLPNIADARTPRNHLTHDKNAQASPIEEAIEFEDATENPVQGVSEEIVPREQNILRLHWSIVPNAVKYEIFIGGMTLVSFTNGIEIPVNDLHAKFQVNAISLDGTTLENKIPISNIDTNPTAPRTTTEFDKMNYPPIYPVYSWIPTSGADHYEVELIRDDKIVRRYFTPSQPQDDNFDLYDKRPVLEEGEYFWRVRGLTVDNQPVTEWSTKDSSNSFTVKHQIRFCALGDSITHGGGSISVPPSTVVYNWETYCAIPIKNLGRSGDTTSEIVERFENDVLPFRPEVLFIMAGVNDYRISVPAWESVENLEVIRDKCLQNGILPVFLTPTPLNAAQIQKVGFVEAPPNDWRERQQIICDWIRTQEYFIDVNEKLTDADGNLSVTLSVDGLHPDADGKRIIGEAVAAWLDQYMSLK
ncbi:MAG: SGNH/GDSL hydrolase family protein [Selenomonadaceae bacterium]|nr:SGNH/GDSL hydrolase family protein [Selenomonadaceae bacterium]